jgi:flagellar biosynthetic protein FlhB
MSKQELRDEHKQQEGSPEVKSKLKAMRAKMSKRRIMAVVPMADVIITNPTHYAVALEYKQETMDTPVVVAKGLDNIAMMIREIGKEHKIPIVENPPLARLLYKDVEIGKQIQEKHYKAVAEVISYIMKLQNKKR